ncbi:helix-turn-helix domain-containing protein [Actinoplanes sp. LDG1-06]|uniref:Helix-turn-helix domain-containing protein n=2 Tax=Paractinoplanes ovalisporus TaxID=2810368 RepID=A0ABS2AVG0_9ACTN|nr:helix-turn-helix domain-containing protein [Actinoplanes ovalisporus]
MRPEDVDIAVNSHRRVKGLRRDELAVLAGISTEYYTRLEQGRDRHPSVRVLDAIARALKLDSAATAYLHGLAEPQPRRGVATTEQIRPSVVRLLEAWEHTPAFIQGRYLDVLAANRLAGALSPLYRPGVNLLRAALLDSAAEAVGASEHVRSMIGILRTAAGAQLDDPRLTELVNELTTKSAVFRRCWRQHEVVSRPVTGIHQVRHPLVGDLELRYDKFLVAGAEDQMLVVYQAEPNTPAAEALSSLCEHVALPK